MDEDNEWRMQMKWYENTFNTEFETLSASKKIPLIKIRIIYNILIFPAWKDFFINISTASYVVILVP